MFIADESSSASETGLWRKPHTATRRLPWPRKSASELHESIQVTSRRFPTPIRVASENASGELV